MWCCIRLGKAPHQEEKENSLSETTRKVTGNHLALFIPRHDMDCATVMKDNHVNEAVSLGLVELHLAANSVRLLGHHPPKSLQQELGKRTFI